MSSALPHFPYSRSYLESIRTTSRALRQTANISIEHEAIQRFLLSPAFTSSFERISAAHGLALPLKFSSVLSELNFVSALALLNFGSGYRIPLHSQTGRGASDNIKALVFSLYIASSIGGEEDFLSAQGMHTIDDQKVAELMGVNILVERPHDTIPGVTVGELGGPVYDLVRHITGVLNETGEILVKTGYPDLGSFVLEALKEGEKAESGNTNEADIDIVLERLVRAIPAFRDMAQIDGEAIYCFKKALFLMHAITIRFGSISPPPFPIPKSNHSPIFSDNVIPSLLVHVGVIDLSNATHSLSSLFPDAGSASILHGLLEASPAKANKSTDTTKEVFREGPPVDEEQAYILRAAAIDACELIVETAQSMDTAALGLPHWMKEISLPKLDMWLWAVAKDRPDYKRLERFVARDTVYF